MFNFESSPTFYGSLTFVESLRLGHLGHFLRNYKVSNEAKQYRPRLVFSFSFRLGNKAFHNEVVRELGINIPPKYWRNRNAVSFESLIPKTG